MTEGMDDSRQMTCKTNKMSENGDMSTAAGNQRCLEYLGVSQHVRDIRKQTDARVIWQGNTLYVASLENVF